MSDQWSEELISAYLDGELTESQRAQVESHLTANPQSMQTMRELAQLSEDLKSQPRRRLPAGFVQEVIAEIKQRQEGLATDGATPASLSPRTAGTVGSSSLVGQRAPWRVAAAAITALAALLLVSIFVSPPVSENSNVAQLESPSVDGRALTATGEPAAGGEEDGSGAEAQSKADDLIAENFGRESAADQELAPREGKMGDLQAGAAGQRGQDPQPPAEIQTRGAGQRLGGQFDDRRDVEAAATLPPASAPTVASVDELGDNEIELKGGFEEGLGQMARRLEESRQLSFDRIVLITVPSNQSMRQLAQAHILGPVASPENAPASGVVGVDPDQSSAQGVDKDRRAQANKMALDGGLRGSRSQELELETRQPGFQANIATAEEDALPMLMFRVEGTPENLSGLLDEMAKTAAIEVVEMLPAPSPIDGLLAENSQRSSSGRAPAAGGGGFGGGGSGEGADDKAGYGSQPEREAIRLDEGNSRVIANRFEQFFSKPVDLSAKEKSELAAAEDQPPLGNDSVTSRSRKKDADGAALTDSRDKAGVRSGISSGETKSADAKQTVDSPVNNLKKAIAGKTGETLESRAAGDAGVQSDPSPIPLDLDRQIPEVLPAEETRPAGTRYLLIIRVKPQ